MAQTRFKSLSKSTADDWQTIVAEQRTFIAALPDRIIAHLKLLAGDYGGFPIDRLQHCLQSAELAAEGGEDDEYVVCALLHDIGDTLGSTNHPDVAAAILYPFVSEANHWMIKHHAIFQGYNFFHHLGMDRDMRERFRNEPHYDRTERFVKEKIALVERIMGSGGHTHLMLAGSARIVARVRKSLPKSLEGGISRATAAEPD